MTQFFLSSTESQLGGLCENDPAKNLLPRDGTVNYWGRIFPKPVAREYFEKLKQDVPWRRDEAIIFGKRITTARKVAWYGDSAFPYTYSGVTRTALVWNADLLALKSLAEKLTGATFNSCLLNLYHDGSEGVGWHSDDEKALGESPTIASLTFGAEREFRFKHKQLPLSASVILESGSLLVMKDGTQKHWRHCLPRTKKIREPRINLTFRTMQ
jgi:alkylated DNA repair dioxygenase AlkB